MSRKPSLKSLQKTWYKKLKDSGFKDIEYKAGIVEYTNGLERGAPNLANMHPTQYQIIEHYYSMARSFLIDHEFSNEVEKTIWEYYSEGLSVRDISTTLNKSKIHKPKSTVFDIVKRLEKIMKQRYLAP